MHLFVRSTRLNKLVTLPLLLLIKVYRFAFSPLLGRRCRFHPSCSEYAQQALAEHGSMTGLYLGVRRLLKCHPWHPGGLDPVPPKTTNKHSPPQTEISHVKRH